MLQNMNLASENGFLNLAGVLLFAKNDPIRQQIVLKNREQIENQRQMLEKMSTNKIEETIPR
ncbi:hypothetical protein HRM2_14990 [Desulforapulum autotrophicum HRM2]|uniref:Uncharacterized protein n=1 Tax=Desulforapulum autotrophicum (strain ATCC 43914 / DSM 3382 / VKM B-1955 / HRM2) TaxID=177437 RepID=C0Q9P4_DESAH|nr:hypothetical protein HRM2_14990 [Desulforapulum autotrophicum HRM2]